MARVKLRDLIQEIVLVPLEAHVLYRIIMHIATAGACFKSELARAVHLSNSNLDRYLKYLEEKGYLTVHVRGKHVIVVATVKARAFVRALEQEVNVEV